MTEKEKNIIRDFYKNHHEFKLSDPSVIENVSDKKVIQEKQGNQNLFDNKSKILITDNNAKLKSKSNATSIIENVGDKNTQSKIVNSDTKITNYDETSLSVVKNQISAKIKEINSVSEAYLKK